MKKRFLSEKGLLSLEASIAVTIFIFLMLFMYSFFIVFEARNEFAHTILATADSLSKDTYSNEKIGNSGTTAQLAYDLVSMITSATGTESDFASMQLWNEVDKGSATSFYDGTIYASNTAATEHTSDDEETDEAHRSYVVSTGLGDVIKQRFLAYMGNNAEQILERYHIKNGSNGLDFSGSYISSGKLYVSVKYTIEYEFQVFNLDGLQMEQTCCSKLWK